MATVSSILDALHSINQTIMVSGMTVKPFRYFNRAVCVAHMPFITPLAGSANFTYPASQTGVLNHTTRQFILLCGVTNWNAGELTETASADTEKFLSAVVATYENNNQLCVSNTPTAGVLSARLASDTGIIQVLPDIAGVRFTLTISYT